MTDTYNGIWMVADDGPLRNRVTACAAQQDISTPDVWAYENRWEYAAAPGWAEAYEYAVANGNPSPGSDPAVITDAQILSQVQSMNTQRGPG